MSRDFMIIKNKMRQEDKHDKLKRRCISLKVTVYNKGLLTTEDGSKPVKTSSKDTSIPGTWV